MLRYGLNANGSKPGDLTTGDILGDWEEGSLRWKGRTKLVVKAARQTMDIIEGSGQWYRKKVQILLNFSCLNFVSFKCAFAHTDILISCYSFLPTVLP